MRSLLALVWVAAAAPLAAQISLPAIFGDHMVLQRDAPVAIWGKAPPGAAVAVELRAADEVETGRATADADGRWRLRLRPRPAGGGYTLTVGTDQRIVLRDVQFGEVWIGSGQSNMQWSVEQSAEPEKEIAAAAHPGLRLFTVAQKVAAQPLDDVEGSWAACAPQTVKDFSAVAYYFGRELHARLGVPVGLIHSSWGGTPAEAWTSREALAAEEICKPILARWEDAVAASKPPNQHSASVLYNAMIAPLTPLSIRGVIWYQGESNAGRAFQYRTLFPAMIRDWRERFDQGDFPFLFVQLANFKTKEKLTWPELREAQSLALRLPNTAMAVAIDIGDAEDIHPRNKQEVGRRLALAALARTYGEDCTWCGPLYGGSATEGARVRIRFNHAAGGLRTADGGPLRGFEVAGADRRFVAAAARIDGDSVVVDADGVAAPLAVRYAWRDDPSCNLVNGAGLPASPFRTDDWPGVTEQAR
jgi:sialate O-acetylesterase